MDTPHHRQLIGLILAVHGIAGELGDVLGLAEHLETDAPPGDVQLGQLPVEEAVHHLGTADEIGGIRRGVLADQLGGEEAPLAGPVRLIAGEDVDHVDVFALQLVQLRLQGDVVGGDGAVEDGEIHVQRAVGHLTGHGGEGRNAHAAGQGHHVLGVPEGLIVELSAADETPEGVAHLHVVVDVVADEAVALGAAYGDLHEALVLACLPGGGGDGIGPGDETLAHGEIQHHELAGVERRQLAAAHLLEAEGLGGLGGLTDLRHHQIQLAGMPLPGHVADGVLPDRHR